MVHYNREYLALNAQPMSGAIERADGWVRYCFADAAGNGIVEGGVAVAPKPSLSVLGRMTRYIGVASIMRLLVSPTFHTRVVNTRRNGADRNLVAHTYCQSDRQTIRYAGAPDRLQVSDIRYAALNLRLEFVQLLDGVRFAYLQPEAPASPC